jgi:hypothetical protein
VTSALRWILLALLGLLVAAGISLAASNLVSQRIGLAAEPLSAGKALAPPVSRDHAKRHNESDKPATKRQNPTSTAPSTTVPATTTAPAPAPSTAPTTSYTPPPTGTPSTGGSANEPERKDD